MNRNHDIKALLFDWDGTLVDSAHLGLTAFEKRRIELGVNAPLIKIFNDRSSMLGNSSGIGDTQFGVKIRLIDEREGSKIPATSVVFYIEAPTGSTRKQIGSGLVDYWLYGVVQKSFTKRTTGRLNGGILFSGNESTGLVGIQSTRGQVFTGKRIARAQLHTTTKAWCRIVWRSDQKLCVEPRPVGRTNRRRLCRERKPGVHFRSAWRSILSQSTFRRATRIRLRFQVIAEIRPRQWADSSPNYSLDLNK